MSEEQTENKTIIALLKTCLASFHQSHPTLAKWLVGVLAAIIAAAGSYFGGVLDKFLPTEDTDQQVQEEVIVQEENVDETA